MEPESTFEHAGLTVRIRWEEFDMEHANPRSDDGNLGVMFVDYDRYTLGDDDAPDPREQTVTCPECDGAGDSDEYELVDRRSYGRVKVVDGRFDSLQAAEAYMERNQPEDAEWIAEVADCLKCEGSGEVEVSIVEYLKREHGARVVLPLFIYEHGGITISAGGNLVTEADNMVSRGRFVGDAAGWDTSSAGVIFDTAESRKECGVADDITDEEIEKQLNEEVRYYAAYLEGFVFGYEIVDPDDEDDVLDSCWGFLEPDIHKDDAYIRVAARESAEYCRETIEHEKAERERWACADVVTI